MPLAKRDWTADDLLDFPDDGNRYEVIDGELFVTPAPRWSHQGAVGRLYMLLVPYVEQHHLGVTIVAPADVRFSSRRLVQPDVFVAPVVGGRFPERFEDVGHLLLAVEVLSPSTGRADRVAKRDLYRDEGVDEYWIVDPDAQTFERSTPLDTRVDVYARQFGWSPAGAAESLMIDVPGFFASLETLS